MHKLFGRAGRRLAFVAILALAGAGIAFATIPDSAGVVHGCYSAKNGALRVIDSTAKCASGELPLNWNQQGPKGDAGPIGPQGAVGPKGDTGATGPQGQSGVVAADGSYGTVPATLDATQWADFRYVVTPVHFNLHPGDRVSATASAVFGTSNVNGAVGLKLGICYRNPSSTGYLRLGAQQDFEAPGPPTTLSTRASYWGFVADQYKPLPITISMTFEAGTGPTDMGLCYQTTDSHWDFNGSAWVSALVVHTS
jgi:hypothetical protein